MFTECSLNVHFRHTFRTSAATAGAISGSLLTASLFDVSVDVHWMFTECSLNVHFRHTFRTSAATAGAISGSLFTASLVDATKALFVKNC